MVKKVCDKNTYNFSINSNSNSTAKKKTIILGYYLMII